MIDVDLIDASGIDGGNRPTDRVLTNSIRQNFATVGQQQLGIAKAANSISGIENDCCGDYGAEKRTTANLVDSGYEIRTGLPSFLFKLQRAVQAFQEAELRRGRRKLLVTVEFEFARQEELRDPSWSLWL